MGCNFSSLKLKKTRFLASKIHLCHFNATTLVEAEFRDSDLEGTLFHHADLKKADFRNAKNYVIDPMTNEVSKAKFSIPEVLSLLSGFDIVIT